MTIIKITKIIGGYKWSAPNPDSKGKIRGMSATLDDIHYSCAKWFGQAFAFDFKQNVRVDARLSED